MLVSLVTSLVGVKLYILTQTVIMLVLSWRRTELFIPVAVSIRQQWIGKYRHLMVSLEQMLVKSPSGWGDIFPACSHTWPHETGTSDFSRHLDTLLNVEPMLNWHHSHHLLPHMQLPLKYIRFPRIWLTSQRCFHILQLESSFNFCHLCKDSYWLLDGSTHFISVFQGLAHGSVIVHSHRQISSRGE